MASGGQDKESAMTRMSFAELRAFYEGQLFEDVLRFWMGRGVDREVGGFFTCFSNRGEKLLHLHKFTWSQGRFVWMLSHLARVFGASRPAQAGEWMAAARRGAEFLMKYARLPDGSCSFILSREGRPILLNEDGTAREARAGESYDTSVYADLFVTYGLAEYSIAAKDRRAYAFARELYDSAVGRFFMPVFKSEPYPVPSGYEIHGRPMMLVELTNAMSQGAELFGDPRRGEFLQLGERSMAEVLGKFRTPENVIIEFWSADPEKRNTMLGSYVNPGHMLESMWFNIHLAERLGLRERVGQSVAVMAAAAQVGWDEAYGGLHQFVHRSGGPPRGIVPPELAEAEMIRKLKGNWDNKLWWPHSEALYALLLGYRCARDEALLEWYWRVHEYTYRTFPNPDRSIGEWVHIRDREGAPVDKVVALPVKDPFHITRVYSHLIELCAEME
jgi:N-acylglucosamine 2-epimerase